MNGTKLSRRDVEAQLVENARLLVSYTAAEGRTSPILLERWAKAESEFEAGDLSPAELDSLREVIQREVKAISPATLADIRAGSDPLKRLRAMCTFYVLCVLVLLGCLLYSSKYVRIRENITHLQQLQDANIEDAALKFYSDYYKSTLVKSLTESPPGLEKDRYLSRLEQLEDYDRELSTFLREAQVLESEDYLYRSSIANINSTMDSKNNAKISHQIILEPISSAVSLTPSLTKEANPLDFFLDNHLQNVAYTTSLGSVNSPAPSLLSVITHEHSSLEFVGSLYLPGFLSALGALVYLIRPMTDLTLGAAGARLAPALDAVRLLLRVMMGAVAGVSGSIFGLTMNHPPAGQYSSSVWPFAVAFVLGFSIDLFFRILDLLVQNIAGWLKLPESRASAHATIAEASTSGPVTVSAP